MIGTITNAGAILIGCAVGGTLKKGIGERYKTVMMDAMGLAATALGINAIVQAMPASRYRVLFIVSLALGGLIGTKLSLDTAFARAVSKISGGSNLAQGLSTAILLYCAGTLSILGPMESALHGDNTYLFTNAILDGISSVVLSSTFGFGIALGRRRPLFMAGRHLSAGQRDRAVSYTRSADGTVACRRRADSQFGAWDTGYQAD